METTIELTKILRLIGDMAKENIISMEGKNILKCKIYNFFIDLKK